MWLSPCTPEHNVCQGGPENHSDLAVVIGLLIPVLLPLLYVCSLRCVSYMAAPGRCVLWWCGTRGETVDRQPCLTLTDGPPRASLPAQVGVSQRRTEL